jgi:hypothetical protein
MAESDNILTKLQDLLLYLIPQLNKFPRDQKFVLGDRIETKLLDVQEDCLRAYYGRDKRGHLLEANLQLKVARHLVRLINNANGQLDIFSSSHPTPMARFNSSGLTVNGTFVSASGRNVKENFAPVQPRAVLEKVVALPITRWNYKSDAATPHLGPMAQDFYAAFAVGPDDKHIATVDESGVALAAIQGLNQKLNEKDAEIQQLKQRLDKLETLISNSTDKQNGGEK